MTMQSNHWKPILYLLLAVVSTQLMSCRPTPQYPEALLLADSLTQCNADSAVRLLQELAPTLSQAKEPVRRYHQLLTIKAQDKAFIPHTSDSLVLTLLRYYQEEGDPRLLPEACYYAGRVTRDLGDAPQALDYFHQALDALQTSDYQSRMQGQEERTLKLQGKIHAQMGYLFRRQHLYDEAIKAMEEGYAIDSLNQDTLGMLLRLCEVGNLYQYKKEYDLASSCYERSKKLASSINDSAQYIKTLYQEATLMEDLGKYDSARIIIEKLPVLDNYNYLSIVASIYAHCKLESKALDIYKKLTTSSNLVAKSNANLWLGNDANIRGNAIAASEYFRTYMSLEDSLNRQKNENAVILSQSLYNYQLREKKIHKLEIQEYRHNIAAWMLLASVTLLILLFYIEHTRKMKIKQQYELLQGLIAASKMDLEHKKSITAATMKELIEGDIYIHLKKLCEKRTPLKEEEWLMVEKVLLSYFPDFIPKLRGTYNYNETEWKLSLLLKMGFSWAEIASLIGRSYTAIHSSQTRLLKKLFPQGSEYDNWQEFISAL